MSRNLSTGLGLAIPALLLTQALASCGDDDGGVAGACTPNMPRDCAVPGMDCDGTQICNAEGTAYSVCACEATGGGGTDGGGGSGQAEAGSAGSSAGPTNQIPEGVGVPCGDDGDCPTTADGVALLTCITDTSDAEFGIGSPQGGYCSYPCQDTGDCQEVDNLSGCVNLPGGGRCVALCTPGDGTLKCGANRAQACFQTSDDPADPGGCFPMCTSDEACGNGRFCDTSDQGLGLCRTVQPQGGGVGAPCTADGPNGVDEECASGICLTMSDNGVPAGTFCSANCTLFAGDGCGFDAEFDTVRDAACVQARFSGGRGGDLGFCFEMCDVDADCAQADNGWVCNRFSGPNADAAVQAVGRQGQCVPAALADIPVDAGPG